jgi:hypothetical protein
MLELGHPIKGIVQTIIMSGFSEGKWTVDVGMLLIQPLTALLLRIADDAGVKPEIGVAPKTSDTLDKVLQRRLQMEANKPPEKEGGFMKPGK